MEKINLTIKQVAVNRKIIPIYYQNGASWFTSVKLPDFLISNESNTTVDITGITIRGYASDEHKVSLHQGVEDVSAVISETNQLLNKLTQKPTSRWKAYSLHMLFGDVPDSQDPFETSTQLKPKTSTCLRLQDLFQFNYAGKRKIEEIICEVSVESDSVKHIAKTPIQLTPYQCAGDYIFPISGSTTIMGTPWNQVFGHRQAVSQEFAIDVVDYRRDDKGEFVLSSPPNSHKAEDYFLFEREILAVGDGVVVAIGNQWPNEWVENPLNYSEERIVDLTEKLLADGVEFNHAILGNYAIIDHQNGEYSLYAHMSQDTLTVSPGDTVNQGQVIGKVGNTSNSDFPHLHFHLMDSPDYQTANGLPITFKNVRAGQAPICDFSETNSLLYSDYIFIHTT